MSTATAPESTLSEGLSSKFRKTLIGAGFATVLLVPKILSLRRSERSWTAFRTVLGFFGAALVILPLSFFFLGGVFLAVIGLGIFTTAILLPPASPLESTTDEKARELGALVVVNGGLLQLNDRSPVPVQLFVGAENLWALPENLRPLLVISVPEIISARAEGVHDGWILRIRWTDRSAIFSYSGVFAEHFARVAESTINSVTRPSLPVLPRSRAATA
jgi:hypothetical protein